MRTERRRFFESMMLAPNRSAILFLLWAAVAGIVALPGRHWSHHSLVILLVLIGCCLAGAGVWLAFGDRIAPWGLHVSTVITTLMISVAAAIGPSVHDDFAVLYVWTAVFAALYFPAIAASLQIAFAGIAYFVVLLVAHSSLRALVDRNLRDGDGAQHRGIRPGEPAAPDQPRRPPDRTSEPTILGRAKGRGAGKGSTEPHVPVTCRHRHRQLQGGERSPGPPGR